MPKFPRACFFTGALNREIYLELYKEPSCKNCLHSDLFQVMQEARAAGLQVGMGDRLANSSDADRSDTTLAHDGNVEKEAALGGNSGPVRETLEDSKLEAPDEKEGMLAWLAVFGWYVNASFYRLRSWVQCL